MARCASGFVLIAASLLAGCSTGGFLARAQELCNKYPTPDARAECERRDKQVQAAVQQQQAQEASKKQRPESERRNPDEDLCFVRKATGERVCPN